MARAGLAGIAAAALWMWGCASPGPRTSAGATPAVSALDEDEDEGAAGADRAFPSEQELEALARRPAPAEVFEPSEPDPPAWSAGQVSDAAPAQADHAPQGFWEGLLAAQAARRAGAVRLTEPMACLARAMGQLTLEKKAPPGHAARAFLAARCRVGDPGLGYSYVVQPLRGPEPDADLQRHMRLDAEAAIQRALASGTLTAGIWFGRQGQRAVVMLVTAQPMARLDSLPAVPGADGHVIVSGELLRPAEHLDALINRGRHGFRHCLIAPEPALPRFSVDCETDPADDEEVLEVAAFAPRQVMGPIVLRATVWPRGKIPSSWRPLPASPARGPAGNPAAGLVSSLNEVRAAAGLAPVALAPAQSETAVLLAPHYFAAQAKQRAGELDSIAVGVMAGWQVEGRVRSGHFTSGWTAGGTSEAALVAAVLERPSGREALLDPDIRAVAVGAVREGGKLGAVFGTYAFLDASSPAAAAAAVLRRIDEERARRGLPPAIANAALSREVAQIALSVERGERGLRAAMQVVLQRASASARSGTVGAWSGWADDLERLRLPEQLVGARTAQVGVGVAHCRPKGSPWFGYCVLIGAIQQGVVASADEAGTRMEVWTRATGGAPAAG